MRQDQPPWSDYSSDGASERYRCPGCGGMIGGQWHGGGATPSTEGVHVGAESLGLQPGNTRYRYAVAFGMEDPLPLLEWVLMPAVAGGGLCMMALATMFVVDRHRMHRNRSSLRQTRQPRRHQGERALVRNRTVTCSNTRSFIAGCLCRAGLWWVQYWQS